MNEKLKNLINKMSREELDETFSMLNDLMRDYKEENKLECFWETNKIANYVWGLLYSKLLEIVKENEKAK